MKLSFLTLGKLLWRAQDWEKDPKSLFGDSVRHKTRGIGFYSDQAVVFRGVMPDEIVYDAGPFTWAIIKVFLAPRVRRAVFGREKR